MLSVETYQTVPEAAAGMGDASRYLGGGTLVMRDVTYGDQSFRRIIRARQVDRTIGLDSAGIRIGAGATMADLLASRDVDFLHPVARVIGGPAIRNMATVGGNLFAQNPYGDLAVALLALDAQIVLTDGPAQPIEGFLAARDTQRGLVQAVIVPRTEPGTFRFRKVSRIKPKGVSVMSIAAQVRRSDPRIAFGNMGPVALRAKGAERALAQGTEAACAACLEGLAPVTDQLATDWYRQQVAPVHLRRLLDDGGAR